MGKKLNSFLESLVIAAILLVLVQTFLEDFAVLAGWSWSYRKILIFTGFGFDLFFTIEFLTRLFNSLLRGKAVDYITRRRGWIDFLASIPLLVLNSGPAAFTLLLGGTMFLSVSGILNVLKVVKAIRIARILRLMRIMKIFKNIKYAESRMAQRHVTRTATTAVSTFVIVLFIFVLAADFLGIPDGEDAVSLQNSTAAARFSENSTAASPEADAVESFAAYQPNLLILKYKGETLFTRMQNYEYEKLFSPDDYQFIEQGDYTFFFDHRMVMKIQSRNNILYFVIVVAVVGMFMFVYSPHFALTVTDPIHVMRRGMSEKSYNLEVRVPEEYSDDDVFRLAAQYNETFLPMKARDDVDGGGEDLLDLKIEDFDDLLSGGT